MALTLLPLHQLSSGLRGRKQGSDDTFHVRRTFIHYDTYEDDEQPQLVRCASNILDGAPRSWASDDKVKEHITDIVDCYNEKARRTTSSAFPSFQSFASTSASSGNSDSNSGHPSETEDIGADGDWSIGATLHQLGHCKPCAWHRKPSGCSKGTSCTFCHLCDNDALRKKRKDRIRRLRVHRGRRSVRGAPTSSSDEPLCHA
eukprot:TRINITY_DN75832_c0_g1_i1.p1 TRINITY_DN75832_c0_g1~~TRINITY_DN75832_c0_g1_i1.p1  ORF type:complete len:202 (+),score=20.34 TRINITY_DN75832_c0_g1_i1:67-672(+)